MTKWYYFLSLSCIFVVAYVVHKHNSPDIASQKPFIALPQNTVFVFDLHGVVFKKDIAGMIYAASKAPLSIRSLLLLGNPFFWYDFFILFFTRDSAEEIIRKLAHTYPSLEPYIDITIDTANEQLPIQKTVKIIKKLKQQGFRLLIFSNIGITTFRRLINKFPDIFTYFDGYQVTEPKNNWLQKPHKEAYKHFINSFDIDAYNIVFIDDKKSNIRTAQSLGMYGIYFKNEKNISEHIQRLHALS